MTLISPQGENGTTLTARECDLLRQWFNTLSDIAPKYLDEEDQELMMKINYCLNTAEKNERLAQIHEKVLNILTEEKQ